METTPISSLGLGVRLDEAIRAIKAKKIIAPTIKIIVSIV